MARAAAQRRQQEQDAAEAAHGNSTIEKLPADILGVLFGCLKIGLSVAAIGATEGVRKGDINKSTNTVTYIKNPPRANTIPQRAPRGPLPPARPHAAAARRAAPNRTPT